jgi:hypothetical protein
VFTAEGARKLAADLCDKHNHGDPHSRPAIPPESDGQWLTPGLDWNPGPMDRAKIFGAEYHFCPESRLNPGPFSNEDENASAYAQELWASGISEDKLAALEGFWDGGRYYPPPSISPIGNAYHLAQDVCRWKQSQSASDSVEGLSKRGVSTKDAELIVSRGRFHFCPDPVAPTEHEYGS